MRADQGYALVANTAITAGLGLVYWFLAVRLYSPAAFGAGQLEISAMRLFASLTGLSCVGILARYIPLSGRRAGPLIAWGCCAAGLVAVLAALTHGGAGFLAAVLAWTLFTLLDAVLTGLRRAHWVPVNSLLYGAAKLALLVALTGSGDGIFLSWVVPAAVLLLPAAWLVFAVVLPKEPDTGPPPGPREVARFAAGDLPGALCVVLVLFLVPVVVGVRLGDPELFGYFSVAHTIGCMLGLLPVNMAIPLTVAGAHQGAGVRDALRRTLLLVIPAVAVVVAGAPLILGVFSAGLAQAGTPLLRLMALGVVPMALVEIRLATLRALGRPRALAVIQVGLATATLGTVLVLLPVAGISGVGWAMLGCQAVAGALVLPGLVRIAGAGSGACRTARGRPG